MTLRWDLDWIYHFEAAMIDKLLKFAFPLPHNMGPSH